MRSLCDLRAHFATSRLKAFAYGTGVRPSV
jgi:hypothetical protein